MKNILVITLIGIFFSVNAQAADVMKVKEKSTIEKAIKNIKKNKATKAKKVEEKSTLGKWISGEKKITESIPNPLKGLKNIQKALTPDLKPLK
tara:strand:- start:36 stop:314 length:279 start_codon:yes stop_codon:yes gene_type:complete